MLNFFVQSRTHLSLPTACLRAFKTRRDWLRDDSTEKLSLSSSPFSLTHEQILKIEVFNRSLGGGRNLVVSMVIWGEQSMEQGEIVAGKPQDQPVILPGTARHEQGWTITKQ